MSQAAGTGQLVSFCGNGAGTRRCGTPSAFVSHRPAGGGGETAWSPAPFPRPAAPGPASPMPGAGRERRDG